MDEQNRNPAIERMAALIGELERSRGGATLKQLAAATGVTRSSAYRILNSLEAHGLVRQSVGGAYILGLRFWELGTKVTLGGVSPELPRVAQRHLDRTAMELGETAKVSVYDRGSVMVLVGAGGSAPYALQLSFGEVPLHAGAASKVLLAHLSEGEIHQQLGRKLPAFTERTIIDPSRLAAELAAIRDQGWAFDPGEFSLNVQAFGAPVRLASGSVLGAISIPFVAGRDDAYRERLRDETVRLASAIAEELEI